MMSKCFLVGLVGILVFYLFAFLLVSVCCFCEWQVSKKMLDDYVRQRWMRGFKIMGRYADIDVLLEHLTTSDEGNFRTAITQWLEMHQVADVAPVTHAHWIAIECSLHVEKSGACSECGEAWPLSDTEYFYYCPNCGAIMDEEVE